MDHEFVCCEEWEESLPVINGSLEQHQVRRGEALEFKPLNFCPWCATDRRKPKPLSIPSHLEEEGDHPGGSFEEEDGRLVWESDAGPPIRRAAHTMAAKETIQEVLIQGWTVESGVGTLTVKPKP